MHKQFHRNNTNTSTPQQGNVGASPGTPSCSKCGVSLKGWSSVHHVRHCAVAKAAQHLMQRGSATVLSTPVTVTENEFMNIQPDDCTGYEGEVVSEDESSSTSTGNRNEDNNHNASNKNEIAAEISSYLSSLKKFDPSHIVECLHWGPTHHQSKTSESTRVVAKFLRVTMLGDGLSRAHMQAILDFTHDMGGKKAALLPKKINGCWKALTKVFAS